jgi:putative membrane protein
MLYLWLKALHIVAVISWMAALLYLPRLFVYHADAKPGSETSETFKTMERKLLKFIANPASIAVWVLGLWLAFELNAWRDGWLHAKLTLVVLLTGYHHFCMATVKRFARDANARPARFYRMINEIPAVVMVGVVILVVLKPF